MIIKMKSIGRIRVIWKMAIDTESTTTRTAGSLDFTAIGGKRQGHAVSQSLKTTRWNRVRNTRFGKPNPTVIVQSKVLPGKTSISDAVRL
jgi:hypothetical protein